MVIQVVVHNSWFCLSQNKKRMNKNKHQQPNGRATVKSFSSRCHSSQAHDPALVPIHMSALRHSRTAQLNHR